MQGFGSGQTLVFCIHSVRALLRIFFHFLYHQFAFAYDLVAWTVSYGHWKDWILEVVPFIKGNRILEIGHGPGHLQRFLLNRDLVTVAMDESAPMGRLAKHNTNNEAQLSRGLGQELPFRDESFDTVIATFPAEYIYDARTLSEVRRCLSDRGRFVVLPVAMPKNRFLSWLFQITDQAPSDASHIVREKLEEPFIQTEFDVETNIIERTSGTLVLIIATKENHAQKSS